MKYDCPRCAGHGIISAHKNVLGGVCFKCHGAGKVSQKPAAPNLPWRCEYNGKVLFTVKAKSEAAALKMAISRMDARAPAFKGLTSADARVFLA